MLRFEQLSFWEHQQFLHNNTFVIVGAGLVGMSTALSLKSRFPNEKILILERGYLPTGASTKNAGFACFGSPTELYDDLQHIPKEKVWETVELRLKGLELLKNRVGLSQMNYKNCGSWDLIGPNDTALNADFLEQLNLEMLHRFGLKDVYKIDPQFQQKFGFQGYRTAYFNAHEGSVDTGMLMATLYKQCVLADIQFLFATEVENWSASEQNVLIQTAHGQIETQHLFLCTNGLAQQFFADELRPARAQVLITKPLKHSISGTFHTDRGYYYFRNIGPRILLGGGRHLDFDTETTTVFEQNLLIRQALIDKLTQEILPGQHFEIEQEWSGIMGVGDQKKPIIRSLNKNVHAGVRMGGMGIAIGTAVGNALSKLV
jgi:glycine/D-amino acid oxidase-like deaminating enzyme